MKIVISLRIWLLLVTNNILVTYPLLKKSAQKHLKNNTATIYGEILPLL